MSDDETRKTGEAPEPSGSREPADEGQPAAPEPTQPEETADEASPAVTVVRSGGADAGLRLLGAAVTLPWLVLYGITGAWAVTRGAQAFARGLERVDAGYTRFVTPGELVFFGALLLTAFAVLMVCAVLLLFRRRSAMVWLPLLLVAAGLTAGAVWAGVRGGLHPLLWVLLFFGLVYVAVVALVRVVQVTRGTRRGRIVSP